MDSIVYIIDTNVILRYLLDDHKEHSAKARQFFDRVSKQKQWIEIPAVVTAECVHVLSKYYHVPNIEIADKLLRMLNFRSVVNKDRAEQINALLMFQNSDFDFVDCLLAALSSSQKRIVSFDTDFERLIAHREYL